tara:strand:- start:233 stop:1519 length:1287 start_codon:yes stop_codon:yes gene_type:complete
MAKYKGKNDNKTLIFKTWNRANYHARAFDNTAIGKPGEHVSVVNFNFSEMRYYGKIDDEADPVVVDTTKMVNLGLAGDASAVVKLMLPPQRDMFERIQRKFAQAVRLQEIPEDDPYLAAPTPHNTFVDPIREYKIYTSNLMDVFNRDYLSDAQRINNIKSMADYIDHLVEYLTILGSEYPITLTGWRKSRQSSLLSTGMAVSISDLDCSVDADKEKFLFDKNCVQFYLQACKQYGWSVSKQCPWVLVSDIASRASEPYLGAYSIFKPRTFFRRFYKKTYTLDIDLLRPLIRKSYSDFVKANTLLKEIKVCTNNHDKLVYKNIFRTPINKRDYNNKYDLYFWIPQYIRIRNMEDEFPYNEPALVRITQKASEFEKLLDKEKAMGYINEQFRKKYRYADGSYNYYKKRLEERQKGSQSDIRRGSDNVSDY